MALIRTASVAVRRLQCMSVNLFSKTLQDGRSCSVQHPYSTVASNLNLTVDTAEGIAVVELKRKPVNSLNLELLNELYATVEKLENDRQIKGVVITSAQPKIFSAGLDIMEMYNPKPERLRAFWRALQDLWIRVYVSPLATVAAINGHSPAGGCLVALSCDYRVMASGHYSIGLNETLLGLKCAWTVMDGVHALILKSERCPATYWSAQSGNVRGVQALLLERVMESMKNVIGHRESERALQTGRLYSSEEALAVGLVDEVVDKSVVVQHAKDELVRWLQVPSHARQLTKLALRKPTVDQLIGKQEEDIENVVSFVTRDSTQKSLGRYLEFLKLKN